MTADANQPPGMYPPPPGAGAPLDQSGGYAAAAPQGAYGQGTPPQDPAYGGSDFAGQASAYQQPAPPPQKKGSALPWILAVILLLTTLGGFGWAMSLKSTADKRQSQLQETQAKVSQLESEIKSLNKELEEAKGLTKDQQSTLGKSKDLMEQMYATTLQAAKEMNQIISEFNNVVARFNANDIAGANAAINQANKNIELLKTQLTKYDELAAQFEKTIGDI